MGALQPWHLLIVALVFVLLFGAKKLPEMARSVGQSARVFKSEMKGMQADDEARAQSTAQAPAPQQALPAAQMPTQADTQTQATEGSSNSEQPR